MLPGGRWWGNRLGGGRGEKEGLCTSLLLLFFLGHGCGYGYGVTDELGTRVLWNEWAFRGLRVGIFVLGVLGVFGYGHWNCSSWLEGENGFHLYGLLREDVLPILSPEHL